MSCTCDKPEHSINPRHTDHCIKCSKLIAEPEFAPSIENLGAFLERLAEGMFPAYGRTLDRKVLSRWFFGFYRQCEGRMRAGNKMPDYKYRYLVRSNPREAQEEASDLTNYLFLETMRLRRLGEDEKEHLALEGARHAALAWKIAHDFLYDRHYAIGEDTTA